jgi:polyisoprenoid-binding protein YceI
MNLSSVRIVLGAVSLGVLLLACDNDPAKGKAVATAAPAASTASITAATTTAGSANYTFSNDGSQVAFVGAKVTGKHDGSFGTFKGTVAVPDGDLTKAQVKVELDTASITTDTERLTGHLKSDAFFDVTKFPKSTFTSTAIKAGGDKGATHTVTGNLELHGVTKSITFPATIKVVGEGIEVDSEFAINRKDFQLTYPGKPDDLIKDDVLLKLKVRGKKG